MPRQRLITGAEDRIRQKQRGALAPGTAASREVLNRYPTNNSK